jgi:hypothetical protein
MPSSAARNRFIGARSGTSNFLGICTVLTFPLSRLQEIDMSPASYFRFFGLSCSFAKLHVYWPAPGSADTELGVLMEPEVCHGATEVYTGVQA